METPDPGESKAKKRMGPRDKAGPRQSCQTDTTYHSSKTQITRFSSEQTVTSPTAQSDTTVFSPSSLSQNFKSKSTSDSCSCTQNYNTFAAKCCSWHNRPSRTSESEPTSILGAGRVDPFKTFPIENSSIGLDECFDYCKS